MQPMYFCFKIVSQFIFGKACGKFHGASKLVARRQKLCAKCKTQCPEIKITILENVLVTKFDSAINRQSLNKLGLGSFWICLTAHLFIN